MGESWGKGVLEEREIYPDDMNIVPACLATTDLHPAATFCSPPGFSASQMVVMGLPSSPISELTIPGVEDIGNSRGCAGCWPLNLYRKCLWSSPVWPTLHHFKETWIWCASGSRAAGLASGCLAFSCEGLKSPHSQIPHSYAALCAH